MKDEFITLAHGAGGTQTRKLIGSIFEKAFQGGLLTQDDAALLPNPGGELAMTTDGFIVSPAFFPGGDIGKLSVCGTVNDLACMCARPLYLTCSYIIEEGFPVSQLETVAGSMAETAKEAGVQIVAGDTKVAGKGQCDGIFITTAGVGCLAGPRTGGAMAREGDAVLVTGDIGRHGCAILLSRGGYGIHAQIESDCAPLWGLVESLLGAGEGLHAIRDATRGGVGTVLYEIAGQSGVCVEVTEEDIPVAPEVKGFCGLLGLDPLYMACEGRMVVFARQNEAGLLLEAMKRSPYGRSAAIIGRVSSRHPGRVIVHTETGGERLLAPPSGELLPRIC